MKTIIKSYLARNVLLVIALSFASQVNAEYYFGTEFACSTPCCGSPCGGRMVVERRAVQRIYSPPVKKVKYFTRSRRGSYNSVVIYYVWPTAVGGAVWMPACGGGCAQPQPTCTSISCQEFYVPPEYYTSVTNANTFDEHTADDF